MLRKLHAELLLFGKNLIKVILVLSFAFSPVRSVMSYKTHGTEFGIVFNFFLTELSKFVNNVDLYISHLFMYAVTIYTYYAIEIMLNGLCNTE